VAKNEASPAFHVSSSYPLTPSAGGT
jgi:hypothetical protein